jgi:hypothetical protein
LPAMGNANSRAESLKNFSQIAFSRARRRGAHVRGGQARIDRTLPNIDSVPSARSQSRHLAH